MKKPTLATAFAELREKSGMPMVAVAMKCDISETTVWKVENGRSVRWETVHLLLSAAFKMKPQDPTYQKFQELWHLHRKKMAESQTPEFGTRQISMEAASAVREFRKIVSPMQPRKIKKLMNIVRQSLS